MKARRLPARSALEQLLHQVPQRRPRLLLLPPALLNRLRLLHQLLLQQRKQILLLLLPLKQRRLSNEDALLVDFLIGKTLNDDVANADDTFALPKGTEITREIALDAKKHDALLLLTMSVD